MSTLEFARPHRLDRIGAGESVVEIVADGAERTAIAARFALLALDRLEAVYRLRRAGEGVRATGRLIAAVTQACVASGQPVPAAIDQPFAIDFRPEAAAATGDEIELRAEDCDTIFFSGGAIDLGEAAAETLALALDPFPRSPAADAILREAGVVSEDEAATGAFGALAGLREKLGK